MAIIKAQKVPKKKEPSLELIARFCYHFQQYTFAQARDLPHKYIKLMLMVGDRERAIFLYNLTQAIASPHSKGGRGVSKMLEYYKQIIEGR